jgi:6-phospho-3-hexuloisomerase
MVFVPTERPRPWLAATAEVAELASRITEGEFWALVDTFRNQKQRWFFTGQGRSGLVAAMIAMRFMHIGRCCHFVGEATAPAIRAGDGLAVVSGSGATPTSITHASIARDEGAIVVAITGSPESALGELSDVILHVPVVSSVQLGGDVFEQMALILLDSVVTTLGQSLGNAVDRLRQRHTNLQ